jgi:hypothetical protein
VMHVTIFLSLNRSLTKKEKKLATFFGNVVMVSFDFLFFLVLNLDQLSKNYPDFAFNVN